MKRLRKLYFLVLILAFTPQLYGQLLTHDPTTFMQQTRDMVQKGIRHVENMSKLKRTIEIAKNTRETLRSMRQFQEDIQHELRFLGDLKDLRITDIERILEGYFCLEIPHFGGPGKDHFREIAAFLKGGYCYDDARNLRAYFDNGTSIENSAPEFVTFSRHSAQNLSKAYARERMVQERLYQLALLYENLSKDLMEKSEELRRTLTQDGGNLKMTAGERTEALAAVQELSLRAIEFKEKSAEALEQAAEAGPAQAFYNEINRRALAKEAELEALSKLLELE